ncbi:MAG: cation diffusion facilitator family transporter [Leptolyngbyaceae cyanobacterium bins.302]|nr:cation diffusion facilitator family transporter [Leptolyngbyaceae cyanobacterium bins.302]
MTEPHLHSSDCAHCGNHAHIHFPAAGQQQRLLLVALLLILSFAGAEWVVGLTSHSLTLMADSGHMASDGLAIALAILAVWLAKRPDAQKQSWENWAALLNGLALGGIACWILWEAVSRFHHPAPEIASMPVLITAGVGAIVNGINVKLLHSSSHESLNLRAAFLHVLADTISSLGVILAAIAIAVFHWFWVDGAVSLLVALFILYNAILVVNQTLQALRQNHPANLKDFTKNEV